MGEDYFAGESLGFRSGASSQLPALQLRGNFRWRLGEGRLFQVDVASRYSAAERAHYFLPYEFYFAQEQKNSAWAIGRRRHLWSRGDEFWRQGLWQPRAFHEKLTPESAGLMGLWGEVSHGNWRGLIFASPLFIPEFGPQQSLQEEQFVSANPWFRPPANQIVFNSVPTPVRYDLAQVRESDLVNHPSLALSLEHRSGPEGWFLRSTYAYKPMNQLVMSFPLQFALQAQDPHVRLVIHPKVVYHQLLALEGGVESVEGVRAWLNVTREIPDPQEVEVFAIQKAFAPAWLLSGFLEGDGPSWRGGQSHIYGAFFSVEGGDAPDLGSFAPGGGSLFERRYQYQRALALGLRQSAGRWQWDQRWTYEVAQRMLWWNLRWDYLLDESWSFLFQADLLTLVDNKSPEVGDGFLRDYRANDRLALGVSYVF